MAPPTTQPDEALARRTYAYFVFRLRQPPDAERLTRLTFERIAEAENMGRWVEKDAELAVFATARAVIADNPRPRRAVRVAPERDQGPGASARLSDTLAMAIGRLPGRERDALALRFGAELSIGEIAELLDRTPADVKQRLARGTRMLLGLGVLPRESRAEKSAAQRSGARRAEQREGEQDQADG
jgi:DNA-directed RNA polymerase specialized sigma24 family protein